MKAQRDDDHAGKIAEKLLEGWTLLAEYCPVEGCLAPLMRSRDGRKFCVAHNMFVMSSEEAEAMKKSGVGVGEAATPSRPTPAAPSEPSSLERIDFYQNLKNGSGGTPTSRLGRAPSAALAPAAPAPMDVSTLGYSSGRASPSSARGGDSNIVDVKATAQRTVETLAGKMEEARVLLSSSKDFAQSSELIKFIEECAAAIKSCEGI